MQTLADTILAIVSRRAGISDVELASAIHGRPIQQLVNGECRMLARQGRLDRRPGPMGIIGNHPKLLG